MFFTIYDTLKIRGGIYMGRILGAYMMPHPPIIIPEIGRGEEKKVEHTIETLDMCAVEIGEMKPDTIILITPHGPAFQDVITILGEHTLSGDFSRFGLPTLSMQFQNDDNLIEGIMDYSKIKDIDCVVLNRKMADAYGMSIELEWGAMVPLYFITRHYKDFRLLHITTPLVSYEDMYRFGAAIQSSVEKGDSDVVIISSGDLSHRLKVDGPYGFHPMGPKLDNEIVKLVGKGDGAGLLNMDKHMIEEGGECGLRAILTVFGALKNYCISPTVLSYQDDFGVGYMVARIGMEDTYVNLAKNAVEAYVLEDRVIKPDKKLPEDMLYKRAAVFVSIKKDGALRGCIGTIAPVRDNIAEEIICNAISAATSDPRFFPVEKSELSHLSYSVDVLSQPEEVESIESLNAEEYGVIVKKGHRRGVLLPNLEGVDTPEEQISIALSKGGIPPEESYAVERFRVIRHGR